MFAWLKKERCKVCRVELAVRYCLRRNKDLGWECCNDYRSDGRCPEPCPYTPQKKEADSPLPQLKTDSRTEFLDFLKKYLQYWMHSSIADLSNSTPHELAQTEEGKLKLKEWLVKFSYPDAGILDLLNDKLDLDLPGFSDAVIHPEVIARQYFNTVITQAWEKVLAFHPVSLQVEKDILKQLTDNLSVHPVLKKTRQAHIINAGLTEDRMQAFVFCELNHKNLWTLIFVFANRQWQLYQSISGTLQDYYAQKTAFRNLASALAKKDEALAYKLLKEADERYPLCADIYYYYGLYYNLGNNTTASAAMAFRQALALDEQWIEPAVQLAMLDMNAKNFESAILIWQRLAEENPGDVNIMNNLGVCHLGLNQLEQAKAVWQKALEQNPAAEIIRKNLEHLEDGKPE